MISKSYYKLYLYDINTAMLSQIIYLSMGYKYNNYGCVKVKYWYPEIANELNLVPSVLCISTCSFKSWYPFAR